MARGAVRAGRWLLLCLGCGCLLVCCRGACGPRPPRAPVRVPALAPKIIYSVRREKKGAKSYGLSASTVPVVLPVEVDDARSRSRTYLSALATWLRRRAIAACPSYSATSTACDMAAPPPCGGSCNSPCRRGSSSRAASSSSRSRKPGR